MDLNIYCERCGTKYWATAPKNCKCPEETGIMELASAYESAKSDDAKTQAALEYVRKLLNEVTLERDEARAVVQRQQESINRQADTIKAGYKPYGQKLDAERAKSAKLVEALHMAIDESIKSGHSGLVIYLQQKLREHSSDSPVKSGGDLQNMGPGRPGQEDPYKI